MSVDYGFETSKVNIEVSSIILAVIAITFQASPTSDKIVVFPQLAEFSAGLGIIALIFAIMLFADDIYSRARKDNEQDWKTFGPLGYKLMKLGLLLGMLATTARLFPIPLSWLSCLRNDWQPWVQLTLQLMLAIIPYLCWRTYKNMRIHRSLWKVI